MAVAATGSMRLVALPQVSPADPQALLIGTAAATGDASGGTARASFVLPSSYAYHLDFLSLLTTASPGTALDCLFQIFTGNVNDGQNTVVAVTKETTRVPVEQTGFTLERPHLLVIPDAQVNPQVTIGTNNINGLGYTFSIRFRAYSLETFKRLGLGQIQPLVS